MCGIVGGIGLGSFPSNELIQTIAHRGPDSSGSLVGESIFLGHSRLSILDLSERGSQPMFSEDGRYVIVFNGEIYNHLEIREALSARYTFKSTSDTETILYAFAEYGETFLAKLNGIFALAIYDKETKEIFIARDQLGVKPLYIYKDESQFLFSSELKSFLQLEISKGLAPRAFANYLTFLYSPGSSTPFEKVTKLLPGHFYKFRTGEFHQASPQKYYQIPFNGKYSQDEQNELVAQLDNKLIQAVERQLLSDAPVGFFLAMAKKLRPNERLQCFTIETSYGAGNEGFEDDLQYAKMVAKHLDVDLHIVKADVDIVRDFDKMIWHLDEPQSDASPLNVLNICSLARSKGIKVLILTPSSEYPVISPGCPGLR